MFCHPHVSNWSLKIVFSSIQPKRYKVSIRAQFETLPTEAEAIESAAVHLLRLIVSFLCATRNCLGIFPRFSFPHFHFHFPLPTPGTIASRVTIKGEENRLCGRWRAAAIFMYFFVNFRYERTREKVIKLVNIFRNLYILNLYIFYWIIFVD